MQDCFAAGALPLPLQVQLQLRVRVRYGWADCRAVHEAAASGSREVCCPSQNRDSCLPVNLMGRGLLVTSDDCSRAQAQVKVAVFGSQGVCMDGPVCTQSKKRARRFWK